jgi:hypothetical protein
MTKLNPTGDHVGAINQIRGYGDGVSVGRVVREMQVRSIHIRKWDWHAGPEPQRVKRPLMIVLLQPLVVLIH